MPYKPAMKLKITGHMFVASQKPEAFAAAAAVLDKAKAAIEALGFEEVEIAGTVGQLRRDAEPKNAPKMPRAKDLDQQIGDAVEQAANGGGGKR